MIFAFVFVVGGLGGMVFDRYVLPKLSTSNIFSRCSFLRKANENVTVINKIEQVVTHEEAPIKEVVKKASDSMVSIVSNDKNVIDGKNESKTGIGVSISSDGLIMTTKESILTNNAEYKVFTSRGESFSATMIAIDEYSELAFLKVEASNFNVIPFANGESLNGGQKVIAMGRFLKTNQNSISIGFIEGYNDNFNLAGTNLSYSDKLEGVLETSFDESRKYEGGIVINYNGEMVGITKKVVIDNKDYYFQIPVNKIKETVDMIFEAQIENRAKLGVYYISLNNIKSEIFKAQRNNGALVYAPSGRQSMAVIAASAGQKAGIKIGDIIVSIDGKEVDEQNSLSRLVSKHKKGEKVEMIVNRKGEELKLEVQF